MSKSKSTTKRKKLDTESNNSYNAVIDDAETMIGRLNGLAARLGRSVQTFKGLRKAAAPFPGQQVKPGTEKSLDAGRSPR